MMFGLNFGAPDVSKAPDYVTRKRELRRYRTFEVDGKRQRFLLAGLTNDVKEKEEMIITATNGHRVLRVEKITVKIKGVVVPKIEEVWYGIYAH